MENRKISVNGRWEENKQKNLNHQDVVTSTWSELLNCIHRQNKKRKWTEMKLNLRPVYTLHNIAHALHPVAATTSTSDDNRGQTKELISCQLTGCGSEIIFAFLQQYLYVVPLFSSLLFYFYLYPHYRFDRSSTAGSFCCNTRTSSTQHSLASCGLQQKKIHKIIYK